MPHAVIGGEIVERGFGHDPPGQRVHGGIVPVGQKYRTGLGIQRIDLAHPIRFLVGACVLVLADAVAEIVVHRGGGHQADLFVIPHDQAVQVIHGPILADQDPGIDHLRQIPGTLGIDGIVVGIGPFRQIDFRFGDVQETPGAVPGAFAGLGGVEHIIGWRHHVGGMFGHRPQAGEGHDQGHETSSATKRTAGIVLIRPVPVTPEQRAARCAPRARDGCSADAGRAGNRRG